MDRVGSGLPILKSHLATQFNLGKSVLLNILINDQLAA